MVYYLGGNSYATILILSLAVLQICAIMFLKTSGRLTAASMSLATCLQLESRVLCR
jgi:hypothetical protein